MDEMNKDREHMYCSCPMCRGYKNYGMMGHGGNAMHGILRLLLGIIILLIVFALGVKIGEFKGEFRNARGFNTGKYGMPMMQWNGGGYYDNEYPYPMMFQAPITPQTQTQTQPK